MKVPILKQKDKLTFTGKQLREFAKLNFDTGYDKGYKEGRNNSLKHNINLMKGQILK